MNVLVLDASVLVALVASGDSDGRWAESLLAGDAVHLAGPELLLAESVNILRRTEQAGQLSSPAAAAAHGSLLDLDVTLFPYGPFSGRVWALRSNLTCYDAWYVAVAEALDAPLATLDRQLSRSSGPRCRFLTPS